MTARWLGLLTATIVSAALADPAPPPRNEQCLRRVAAMFNQRFDEPFCAGGSCVENMRDFVRRIKDAGISLEGASILYLRRQDGRTFRPDAARNGKDTRWRHHAVLLLDGKIYDFDYVSGEKEKPEPVPVADYMKTMLKTVLEGDQALRNGKYDTAHEVHVVQIPATDAAQTSLPKAPSDYGETPLLDYVRSLD